MGRPVISNQFGKVISGEGSAPLGQYNPVTLEIRAGTVYEEFHEWAHLEQHVRRTVLWRLRAELLAVPVLCRLAQLGVEIEAAWLARREMRACGIWWAEDAREALGGIGAYLRAVTIL